eukprot:COSAG01_NODE_927_length_12693_cov_16.333810_6_plen_116_part_00
MATTLHELHPYHYLSLLCGHVNCFGPSNTDGLVVGMAARITNLRSGVCVDGVVGDCGGTPPEGGCKVQGYGEISYAAAKAIGVYVGPEQANSDAIQIQIGVAPNPELCRASASEH